MSGKDELFSLSHAAALAGLSLATVRGAAAAQRGHAARLHTVKIAHDRLTTHRWLQEYLESRDDTRLQVASLPAEYQAPE